MRAVFAHIQSQISSKIIKKFNLAVRQYHHRLKNSKIKLAESFCPKMNICIKIHSNSHPHNQSFWDLNLYLFITGSTLKNLRAVWTIYLVKIVLSIFLSKLIDSIKMILEKSSFFRSVKKWYLKKWFIGIRK